jgi:uncharacterized protein (TIGR03067 family)
MINAVLAAMGVATGQALETGLVSTQVVALTKGVLKSMVLTKLKTSFAVLLALSVAASGGWTVVHNLATTGQAQAASFLQSQGEPPLSRPADAPKARIDPAASRPADAWEIQGEWVLISVEREGKKPKVEPGRIHLTITDELMTWKERVSERTLTYQIAPSRNPKLIDMRILGKTIPGIYRLEEDTLTICEGGAERPTDFSAKEGSGRELFIYRRRASAAADVEKRLLLAFGEDCKEIREAAIKLDIRSARLALATSRFSVEADGRVKLTPCRMVFYHPNPDDAQGLDLRTIRAKEAHLIFEGPVRTVDEMGRRKLLGVDLPGGVHISFLRTKERF